MEKKRSDRKKTTPLDEALIEEQLRSIRESSQPCPRCQVQDPFPDLDTYRRKIETKIETKTGSKAGTGRR
jgi:hypothetical protein